MEAGVVVLSVVRRERTAESPPQSSVEVCDRVVTSGRLSGYVGEVRRPVVVLEAGTDAVAVKGLIADVS